MKLFPIINAGDIRLRIIHMFGSFTVWRSDCGRKWRRMPGIGYSTLDIAAMHLSDAVINAQEKAK